MKTTVFSVDEDGDITLNGKINDVDINELKDTTNNLSGAVSTHINNANNPHQVTLEQVRTANNSIEGSLDFNQNQAKNFVIENLANMPTNPVSGQIYLNTTDNFNYFWD